MYTLKHSRAVLFLTGRGLSWQNVILISTGEVYMFWGLASIFRKAKRPNCHSPYLKLVNIRGYLSYIDIDTIDIMHKLSEISHKKEKGYIPIFIYSFIHSRNVIKNEFLCQTCHPDV